jgi:hypothetical protein
MSYHIEVSHYGIHWASNGLAWLEQGRSGVNAMGLREVSPFIVRAPKRKICNHLIALNAFNPARPHLVAFENLLRSNSLMRFMLPLPKNVDPETPSGVTVLRGDVDYLRLTLLAKMSSPIKPPFLWMNMASQALIMNELEATNVQPLVLMGVQAKHTAMIRDIAAQAAMVSPRRLLIVADQDVPINLPGHDSQHLLSQHPADLAALPWESLGAIVTRAYMRNEWNGVWFDREPTPANEAKVRNREHDPSTTRLPS